MKHAKYPQVVYNGELWAPFFDNLEKKPLTFLVYACSNLLILRFVIF